MALSEMLGHIPLSRSKPKLLTFYKLLLGFYDNMLQKGPFDSRFSKFY